jgi:hypothetical protein
MVRDNSDLLGSVPFFAELGFDDSEACGSLEVVGENGILFCLPY